MRHFQRREQFVRKSKFVHCCFINAFIASSMCLSFVSCTGKNREIQKKRGQFKKRGEMLTCITCSKQRNEDDDDDEVGARGTPSSRDSVKGLTSQVLILYPHPLYNYPRLQSPTRNISISYLLSWKTFMFYSTIFVWLIIIDPSRIG